MAREISRRAEAREKPSSPPNVSSGCAADAEACRREKRERGPGAGQGDVRCRGASAQASIVPARSRSWASAACRRPSFAHHGILQCVPICFEGLRLVRLRDEVGLDLVPQRRVDAPQLLVYALQLEPQGACAQAPDDRSHQRQALHHHQCSSCTPVERQARRWRATAGAEVRNQAVDGVDRSPWRPQRAPILKHPTWDPRPPPPWPRRRPSRRSPPLVAPAREPPSAMRPCDRKGAWFGPQLGYAWQMLRCRIARPSFLREIPPAGLAVAQKDPAPGPPMREIRRRQYEPPGPGTGEESRCSHSASLPIHHATRAQGMRWIAPAARARRRGDQGARSGHHRRLRPTSAHVRGGEGGTSG